MSVLTSDSSQPRNLIFISHASPDDNPMTVWLASRLTSAGYKVWNDVEKLDGGDPFWADIEAALRHQTVKYLLLASQLSVSRNGVLTELQEASNVSKKLNDPRFIIPIKVDSLPWDEFPILSNRNNGIDFSTDWGLGLSRLLATLERDLVPRAATSTDIERVCTMYSTAAAALEATEEAAVLNWLPIHSLPDRLYYAHAGGASEAELRSLSKDIGVPHEIVGRLVVSFADPDSLRQSSPKSLELTDRFDLSLDDFLAGGAARGPQTKPSVARNLITSIVRQAWSDFLTTKGLCQHSALLWYVPTDWRDKNRASYTKPDGVSAYRALAGKAKEHTWHFAVASRILLKRQQIQVTPHVLFSAHGGTTPYDDQKQLRRRHCKMWWNDTWRDRMQALTSAVFADSETSAAIPLGGSAHVYVGNRLASVTLPYSYSPKDAFVPTEEDEFGNDMEDATEVTADD